MRLFVTVICAYVCLEFAECLLDQGPFGNGHTDQLIQELQRNFSTFQHAQREMELQLSLLKKQYTIDILIQNQTITAQRQKILELEQKQTHSAAMMMERNKTVTNLEQKIIDQDQKIADQDKKITDQDKKIADQDKKIADQDKTSTDQDNKIVMLENTLNHNVTGLNRKQNVLEQAVDHLMLSQNATINITSSRELDEIHLQQQEIAEMERRWNQSFSSYEVILHDVVDKQNEHAATYTNKIQTLNQSAARLSQQFHYLALSVQNAEKMTNLLNTSLNRRFIILTFAPFPVLKTYENIKGNV